MHGSMRIRIETIYFVTLKANHNTHRAQYIVQQVLTPQTCGLKLLIDNYKRCIS